MEAEEGPMVSGLLLEVWAALFRQHPEILDPVLPWLRQELRAIFGTQWWEAMAAENLILNTLCGCGDITEQQAVMPPSFGHWQGLAQSVSCLDSCRASV